MFSTCSARLSCHECGAIDQRERYSRPGRLGIAGGLKRLSRCAAIRSMTSTQCGRSSTGSSRCVHQRLRRRDEPTAGPAPSLRKFSPWGPAPLFLLYTGTRNRFGPVTTHVKHVVTRGMAPALEHEVCSSSCASERGARSTSRTWPRRPISCCCAHRTWAGVWRPQAYLLQVARARDAGVARAEGAGRGVCRAGGRHAGG